MSPGRASLWRFYGLGALVLGGLIAASAFRVGAVVPEDRMKAVGYLAAAFTLGTLYIWNAARGPGSPWVQDPSSPGNHRYWRLMLAGVIVPLLDAALAGGVLLVVAGFVSSLIVWVCLSTLARSRRATAGSPGPSG